MPVCKSCGETIIWVEMASGKKMPLNPLLYTVVTMDPGTGCGQVVQGRKPHWATCSGADSFRGKGGPPDAIPK
jgi:hypothetical protein